MAKLELFGKHIPGLLRRQLILKLTQHYIEKPSNTITEEEVTSLSSSINQSSIERFHCALLFVDISGFTILSQRLNVDELRLHINAYFKRILDIIDKYGGETIKFAGDALFIVWQTKSNVVDIHSEEALKALQAAVSCGLEINAQCSNYEIKLNPLYKIESSPLASFSSTQPGVETSLHFASPMSPLNSHQQGGGLQEVTFLNVHSGVSMGLMAGIDVTANDRSEYLLLGEPLSEVAVAEGDAKAGELVISSGAHAVLHREFAGVTVVPSSTKSSEEGALPCKCLLTDHSYYKLFNPHFCFEAISAAMDLSGGGTGTNKSTKSGKSAVTKRSIDASSKGSSKSSWEEDDDDSINTPQTFTSASAKQNRSDKLNERTLSVATATASELDTMFGAVKGAILETFGDGIHALVAPNNHKSNRSAGRHGSVSELTPHEESLASNSDERQHGHLATTASANDLQEDEHSDVHAMLRSNTVSVLEQSSHSLQMQHAENYLKEHFSEWLQPCLLDDIAKHVHEASRTDYMFSNVSRNHVLFDHINAHTAGGAALGRRASLMRHTRNVSQHDESLMKKLRNEIFASHALAGTSRQFSGELRNVLVMFININMNSDSGNELFIDPDQEAVSNSKKANLSPPPPNQPTELSNVFHFLTRTAAEKEKDVALAARFQQCMEIFTSVFSQFNGQMRQFIVDDKGTVCIGTFGLKGAVCDDNAASALRAGRNIILQLESIGLSASIGVTSGKAYCGLVGSPNRHEFAVMGPSTNLSARLMCKAKPSELICDQEVKVADRSHSFTPLGMINAKGYNYPVPIFVPKWSGMEKDSLNNFFSSDSKDEYSDSPEKPMRGRTDSNGGGGLLSREVSVGGTLLQREMSIGGTLLNREASMRLMSGKFNRPDRGALKREQSFGTVAAMSTTLKKGFTKVKSKIQTALLRGNSFNRLNLGNTELPIAMQGRVSETQQLLSFILSIALPPDSEFVKQFMQIDTSGAVTANLKNLNISIALLRAFASSNKDVDLTTAPVFSHHTKSKFVVVEGVSGVGKSKFLESIALKIATLCRLNSTRYNVSVFTSVATSFNKSILLFVWRSIMSELFVEVGQFYVKENNISLETVASTLSDNKKFALEEKNKRVLIKHGVQHLFSFLSPELQAQKSLLGFLQVVAKTKESKDSLSTSNNNSSSGDSAAGQSRLEMSVELIAAVLHQYPVITKKTLVLFISDIQFIDSYSLQVLNRIWSQNSGITVITSCRSLHASDLSAARTPQSSFKHALVRSQSSSTFASLFDAMNFSLERYLKFELQPLSPLETANLVKNVLKVSNKNTAAEIAEIDDFVYERIYCMSGGNPLYVVEITKSAMKNLVSLGGPPLTPASIGWNAGTPSSGANTVRAPLSRQVTGNMAQLGKDIGSLEFHTNRIDEIICFRFDQMDSISQYFLKVASVACAYSKVFTLAMISHMMEGGDTNGGGEKAVDKGGAASKSTPSGSTADLFSHSSSDIAWILFSILKSNEFVRVTDRTTEDIKHGTISTSAQQTISHTSSGDLQGMNCKSSDSNGERKSLQASLSESIMLNDFDASSLEMFEFEFRVELEQTTVYDLMLNDQKAWLHSRMADFLQLKQSEEGKSEKRTSDPDTAISDLYEQGFHWKLANKHSQAMVCFYQCSVLLDHMGAYQDQLSYLYLAYNCYSCMRTDAGVLIDEDYQPSEFPSLFKKKDTKDSRRQSSVAGSITSRFSLFAGSNAAQSKPVTKNLSEMKRIDVFRIFRGDSILLETGLRVLTTLGTTVSEPSVMAQVFDEALQIIILVGVNHGSGGHHTHPSSKHSSPTNETGCSLSVPVSPTAGSSNIGNSDVAAADGNAAKKFSFRSPKELFPILSTVIHLLQTGTLTDDGNQSRATAIGALYLKLSTVSEDLRAFYLVGLCYKRSRMLSQFKFAEVFILAHEIRDVYDPETHSLELLTHNQEDIVPCTMVSDLLVAQIIGDVKQSDGTSLYVQKTKAKLTHRVTLALTTLSLISTLIIFNKNLQLALELCDKYLSTERQFTGTNAHFHDLFLLYKEWTMCALRCENCSLDARNYREGHKEVSSTLLESLMRNKYLSTIYCNPMHDTVDNLVAEPEYICASVCMMQARIREKQRNGTEYNDLLVTALSYINTATELVRSRQLDNSVKLVIMLLKTEILCMLHRHHRELNRNKIVVSDAEAQKSVQYSADAERTLLECADLAQQAGSPVCLLLCGVYFEVHDVDSERGVALQQKAHKALVEINGAEAASALVRKVLRDCASILMAL